MDPITTSTLPQVLQEVHNWLPGPQTYPPAPAVTEDIAMALQELAIDSQQPEAAPEAPLLLVLLLGGFFVLTVGGLGLRGATALIGNDIVSGFGDLRDFLIQMPTVAVALALGVLATEKRPSAR